MFAISTGRAVRRASMLLLAALIAPIAGVSAQSSSEPTVCLGFAFGSWTPALDWRAAGHGAPLDPRAHARAGDGRDWATTQHMADSTILLIPGWWPAGVSVTLPNRSPTLGDTVVGHAFAYVADSRKTAPVARVRAWRVPCASRRPEPTSSP